tara:strand:- start:151 stop:522 length:372 start_codon:yes stop_codon:yes gene_type:complete
VPKLIRAGDTIAGARISYEFGSVPPVAKLKDGRYYEHMKRTGRAVVEARVFVANLRLPRWAPDPADLVTDPLASIHCAETKFSCTEKPKLPGDRVRKSGKHTGHAGVVTGDALFKITKPLPGR